VQRLSVVAEHREIDPPEIRPEPGAPDDVCHLEDAVVLQQGQTVPHAQDPGHALHAGGLEVFCSRPDQRGALGNQLRAQLPADPRVDPQHAMPEEPEDAKAEASRQGAVSHRDLVDLRARQQARMRS
jgi:hypothetical protein